MSSLEFDSRDFLECFDDAFLACVDDTLRKRDRDNLYNQLKNEVERFILSIKEYDIKSHFVEVDEIEFMLSVFEIVDSEDSKSIIDLEKFLEHMKKFSKRHRNITKSLDDINIKLLKQDMKIENMMRTEHCSFSCWNVITDTFVIFTIIGGIFYFIENTKLDDFEVCNIDNYSC